MQGLDKLKRFAHRCQRFVIFVAKSFWNNDGTYRASALTFTTLLAIVPLMSVTLTILAAFPVFQKILLPIQDYIFENFVPATGKVVQGYLQTFTSQASKLSVTGIIALLVTAVLMMFTIERALNHIWRARRRRKGSAAFLLYWAVLSLTPILLGFSVALSSYVFSLPALRGTLAALEGGRVFALQWAPLILTTAAFTFLYYVVPNRRVKFSHSLVGALFAAFLFESAKWGFAHYLQRFDTYQLIYGAFATVPIFFLWVYWVWVIVLLGGEVAHALSASYDRRLGPKLDPFTHAFRWLDHYYQAQKLCKSLSLAEVTALDPYNYVTEPDVQLETLVDTKLLKATANGGYILSRDLSRLSLLELSRLLPWPLPNPQQLANFDTQIEMALAASLNKAEPGMVEHLGITLDRLYAAP